jgi:hypothetical protein
MSPINLITTGDLSKNVYIKIKLSSIEKPQHHLFSGYEFQIRGTVHLSNVWMEVIRYSVKFVENKKSFRKKQKSSLENSLDLTAQFFPSPSDRFLFGYSAYLNERVSDQTKRRSCHVYKHTNKKRN